ncbi:MAG: nicotinate-nucleotide adenylyltransferase [Alphaproteobacteria bacterium]|nr:nicotinate-nucleotide adenylyltransferase [Alphaproteobacteria bacterium]
MMMTPHLRSGQAFSGLTVGLLGGSFNPAHDGHFEMSLYALKQLNLDQVWWLVSPQNPLKPASGMADLSCRVASARRLARHPRFLVTDIEKDLGTRYTADTIRVLKKRFPGTNFVWLMGADNLKQIPRWQKWQSIFNHVPVAVFRRPSYPAGRGLGKASVRFDEAWTPPSRARKIARESQNLLPSWIILDNKLNYTSATKIRKDDPSWPP